MCKCKTCGGVNVYSLELRTDYNNLRRIDPLNDDVRELTNGDLPYYLYMNYCDDCKGIVEVEEY